MTLPYRFSTPLVLAAAAFFAFGSTAEAARSPMVFQGVWDSGIRYRRGDVVVYSNALYQSIARKNGGVTPSSDPGKWQVIIAQGTSSGGGTTPTPTPNPTAPVGQDCSKPTIGANLAGCDLTDNAGLLKDLKLQGINLTGAKLTGDAGNVDLTGAIMRGAILGKNIPQTGAQPRVDKPFTLGSGATLKYVDLTGTQSDANAPMIADGVNFEGVTLSAAKISNCSLKGANLQSADLQNAGLDGCVLTGAIFTGANLRGAILSAADLSTAYFENANLERAVIDNTAKLVSTTFTNVNLSGASFGGNDIRGASFAFVNLTGAIGLDQATTGLDPATGQETLFENTTCPDGAKTDGVAVTTCVGHGVGP